MDVAITEFILAMVVLDAGKVQGGGCPVFHAENTREQQKTSLYLARILNGVVHDLENGVLLICRH